jgi:hypothetical protein
MAMSACSPKEELEWRSRIIDRSFKGNLSSGELALFTSLLLPAKAMGQVFGKPGSSMLFYSAFSTNSTQGQLREEFQYIVQRRLVQMLGAARSSYRIRMPSKKLPHVLRLLDHNLFWPQIESRFWPHHEQRGFELKTYYQMFGLARFFLIRE